MPAFKVDKQNGHDIAGTLGGNMDWKESPFRYLTVPNTLVNWVFLNNLFAAEPPSTNFFLCCIVVQTSLA